MPKDLNPLESGESELYISDFGCGQLATQIALVLAASDKLERSRSYPRIVVNSTDPSRAMTDMGWRMWRAFVKEIANRNFYPELDSLRQVCVELRFDYPYGSGAIRWLSLFHVAYKKAAVSLNSTLSVYVENSRPDAILVTFRQPDSEYAFSPCAEEYQGEPLSFSGSSFELEGKFELATNFRNELFKVFETKVGRCSNELTPYDIGFVKRYLTVHPTEWVTYLFEANGFIYTINRATYDSIDDLPF